VVCGPKGEEAAKLSVFAKKNLTDLVDEGSGEHDLQQKMSTPSIKLQRAIPEDAWAVALVLKHAFREYEHLYTKNGFKATTPEATEIVRRMQEGPVWLAAREHKIVGTSSVVRKENGLYLRGMAVLPVARCLGIGQLLLEHIERFAVEQNCSRLFLSATPFLIKAIRLYEAFGFKGTAEGPHELFGTPLRTMEKLIVPKSGLTSIEIDGEDKFSGRRDS
jgi:GNAT superfamily N-acetyltransferase